MLLLSSTFPESFFNNNNNSENEPAKIDCSEINSLNIWSYSTKVHNSIF